MSDAAEARRKNLLSRALRLLEESGQAALDAFLDGLPDDAAEIRRRIDELSGYGLVRPHSAAPEAPRAPERIGRYRILSRIGAGGMGVVYLAEDVELGRRVALKTLPAGAGLGPRARERFLREARAAARLEHEHIVPVYEVGEEDGVPWFAMRYVRGITLADAIARLARAGTPVGELEMRHFRNVLEQAAAGGEPERSTTESRAEGSRIFGRTYVETACRIAIAVSDALDHAHRQGILHRDVKPSNILIGADGVARLFDFGLASIEDEAAMTRSHDFLGTPFYAAPEQVEGGEIDARADVYSLGVTLFEMLTLRVPFEGETTPQVMRRIATQEPPRPSRWNPLVPRDLETVCLAAMEKSKARRYASAAEFGDDLRRFLELRPVRARPVGALTRLARAARRRPAAAVALLLLALVVVGTPAGLAIANLRIQRERDFARSAYQLLERILFEADVEELGPDTPIVDVLESASRRIERELADDPVTQGRLLMKVGAFFSMAHDLTRAEHDLARARALLIDALGGSDPLVAEAENHLANTLRMQGRDDEAEPLYRSAFGAYHAAFGIEDERTRQVMGNLAGLLMERRSLDEAAQLLEDRLRAEKRADDASAIEREYTLRLLAQLDQWRGNLERAERRAREALALAEQVYGARHLRAGNALGRLARIVFERGRLDEAEALFARQRECYRATYGEGSWYDGLVARFLAEVRAARGDAEGAVRLLRDEAIPILTRDPGPTHRDTRRARIHLALALWQADDREGARRELEQVAATAGEGGGDRIAADATLFLAALDADAGGGRWREHLDEALGRYRVAIPEPETRKSHLEGMFESLEKRGAAEVLAALRERLAEEPK